jgi:hypothetical protein
LFGLCDREPDDRDPSKDFRFFDFGPLTSCFLLFQSLLGKLTRLRFIHPTTQTPDLSCNDIRAKITPPPPLATTPARTTIHQPAATPTAHRKGRMIGAKMNIMIHARSLMAVSFPYQMPQQCRSFADTLPRSPFVRHPCLFVFIHTNNFCD